MDLALSAEQEQRVDSFAALFAKESPPERVRAAEPTGHAPDLWATLIDVGATAMAVDEGHGGEGASMLDLALVAELAGEHLAPAPIIESQVAARLLASSGAALAGDLLPACVDASTVVTLALHPALDRRLPLVPAASIADHVLAMDGDRLVVIATAGQTIRHVAKLGGQPLADLVVPDDAIEIARGAAAVDLVATAIDEWLTRTASALVGIGARALDLAGSSEIQRNIIAQRACGLPR